MFVQRPPGYALSKEEQYLNTARSKLLPKSYGPFEVTDIIGDLITINENGIRHTISVDRVSLDHSRRQPNDDSLPKTTPSETKNPYKSAHSNVTPTPSSAYSSDLHVLDKIVEHHTHKRQRIYKIRWYGYDPKNDKWEPAHHLPQSLTDKYERSVRRRFLSHAAFVNDMYNNTTNVWDKHC